MSLHVFGIRHHGPGCARALRAALSELAPDVLLVEGPSDAADALPLSADPGMVPPVALLVHADAEPERALFYPFAEYSPEWQALRYAAESGIPVRFMDLPCGHQLARKSDPRESAADPEAREDALRDDPIGLLAEAAGFEDHEQWWDLHVEQRIDARGLFDAILEAMSAVREQHVEVRRRELQREAFMRQTIRAAQKQGYQRIAIVCGAWHAPKLATLGPAKPDAELLRGLPRVKVVATWIPWTYGKLTFRSGYGAGVDSPGWYGQLWRHADKAPVVFATQAARLLREQDLDASSANVIETVRLASALASLRELPMPGLAELRDAIEAVLGGGHRARLALIRTRLEIGDSIGQVPESAGQVPLLRDFERACKSLRLKLSPDVITLELDLRRPLDRARSELVHRLQLLEVGWGELDDSERGTGTFRETLQLCWQPELSVELIAANVYGSTVEQAAKNKLTERARSADLASLTELIERALLAGLPEAIAGLASELDTRAAASSDVRAQLEALAPLARVIRYGDVRESKSEHLRPVLKALFERALVGALPACSELDDDAASGIVAALSSAQAACMLLDDAALQSEWRSMLRALAYAEPVHARIRGRACRWLLGQRALSESELSERASLALSPSIEPARAAAWIEGLIEGEGLLLVHQTELLRCLDAWLRQLSETAFQTQLPLLRRAFAALSPAERRKVAGVIKIDEPKKRREPAAAAELDPARVERVLPVLAHILGVEHG
ncbi:MAG TPA: DUF5682 family protein [Polyangiales bacterium]|nr:DUF5682 family protein [Polyangiales bacterium]